MKKTSLILIGLAVCLSSVLAQDKKGALAPAPAPIAPQQGTRQDAKPPAKTNWAIPSEKRVRYDGLEVTIISGPPQRRLATINNRAFLAGESMRVSLGSEKINIQCVEIKERSVMVKVEGEEKPRELRLPAWR